MNHWLIKSEPSTYSIDDLKKDGSTSWNGVRNYQARNYMRDGMKKGDLILFYHSNAEPSGVAGVAKVAKEAYLEAKPSWMMVDVAYVRKLPRLVSLGELKDNKKLEGLLVTKKGTRLSVLPVQQAHFDEILKMAGAR